jgi:phage-related protein
VAFLDGYYLRKKLTIDHNKIDADLTVFQVRIFINADTDIGANCNSDGHDIRFTKDDGTTLLNYEREDFTVAGGAATGNFWVKLPWHYVSSSEDTYLYIYYRSEDTEDGSDEEENVWDYNPHGVWHFHDTPGSPLLVHDSGANHRHGNKISQDNPLEVDAKVSKGYSFDGSDYIDSFSNFAPGVNYTISGLVKFNTVAGTQTLIAYDAYDNYWPMLRLENCGGTARFIVRDNAGTLGIATKTGLVADTWYHIAGVREGNNVRIYVNGVEGTPDTQLFGAQTYNALDLGAMRSGTQTRYFFLNGIGDEFSFIKEAKPAEWIKADYHSCFDTLLSIGEQESQAYQDIPPFMVKDLITPYSGGAWLWLCEIAVSGYDTQYLARNTEDVKYGGKTYRKFNIDIGRQEFSGGGTIPRIQLRIGQDPDKVIEAVVNASEGAYGGTVKLIRVNEKYLNYKVDALEINYGMLVAESDAEWVYFTLGIPNPLTQRIPLRIGSSKICPWALPALFKGPECQYSGEDLVCTGTFEDCYTKGNAVHWGGELGIDPNVARA